MMRTMNGCLYERTTQILAWALVAVCALPASGAEKVNLFNPFTLRSTPVSISRTGATDQGESGAEFLGGLGLIGGRLGDFPDPVVPSVLRPVEIRIPSRPNLRSPRQREFLSSIW